MIEEPSSKKTFEPYDDALEKLEEGVFSDWIRMDKLV